MQAFYDANLRQLNLPKSAAELTRDAIPSEFGLSQNQPNPFNPETEIRYQLPKSGMVHLQIFNVLGEEIITLQNEFVQAGYHSVLWNGADKQGAEVASGVYLYRLQFLGEKGEKYAARRSMLLIR